MRAYTFFDLAFIGGISLWVEDCDPGMAANGGGNNYECIPVNDYTVVGFPVSGVGFAAGMQIGNSLYGSSYGDTFDSYSVGFTGTMSADESFDGAPGSAWSGSWITSDAQPIYTDDFDSYTVEADPIAQTMNGGTGFSAAWEHGNL